MNTETVYYNAYSGITLRERTAIIQFLATYEPCASRDQICEALDYALKVKPSFGGFVMVTKKEGNIRGVIVANCTGMEGFSAGHLFVFATYNYQNEEDRALMLQLMQQAVRYAKGQVAIHVPPGHPAVKLYSALGFKAELLAMRLDGQPAAAVA